MSLRSLNNNNAVLIFDFLRPTVSRCVTRGNMECIADNSNDDDDDDDDDDDNGNN